MEIVWSKLALITYKEIFENLQFRWTKKEMRKFRDLTQSLLQKIATQQITCPVVNEKLSIRKAVVHKNVIAKIFLSKKFTSLPFSIIE